MKPSQDYEYDLDGLAEIGSVTPAGRVGCLEFLLQGLLICLGSSDDDYVLRLHVRSGSVNGPRCA